LLALTSTNGKR
jgi:hypothetical protein